MAIKSLSLVRQMIFKATNVSNDMLLALHESILIRLGLKPKSDQ